MPPLPPSGGARKKKAPAVSRAPKRSKQLSSPVDHPTPDIQAAPPPIPPPRRYRATKSTKRAPRPSSGNASPTKPPSPDFAFHVPEQFTASMITSPTNKSSPDFLSAVQEPFATSPVPGFFKGSPAIHLSAGQVNRPAPHFLPTPPELQPVDKGKVLPSTPPTHLAPANVPSQKRPALDPPQLSSFPSPSITGSSPETESPGLVSKTLEQPIAATQTDALLIRASPSTPQPAPKTKGVIVNGTVFTLPECQLLCALHFFRGSIISGTLDDETIAEVFKHRRGATETTNDKGLFDILIAQKAGDVQRGIFRDLLLNKGLWYQRAWEAYWLWMAYMEAIGSRYEVACLCLLDRFMFTYVLQDGSGRPRGLV